MTWKHLLFLAALGFGCGWVANSFPAWMAARSSPEAHALAEARGLLARGARVDARNTAGETPLHRAAGTCAPGGRWQALARAPAPRMRIYGAHGSRVRAAPREDGGNNRLHGVACKAHSPEMIALLLDHGAPLEARDDLGRTPLLVAVESLQLELAQELLDGGADADAADDRGQTGLHLLARRLPRPARGKPADPRPIALAQMLLRHGADPDRRNEAGLTPLQWAVQNDRFPLRLTRVLLEAGADPEAGFQAGTSPLELAEARGLELVASQLRARGARR